jgi:hypothetical protein
MIHDEMNKHRTDASMFLSMTRGGRSKLSKRRTQQAASLRFAQKSDAHPCDGTDIVSLSKGREKRREEEKRKRKLKNNQVVK